MDSPNAFYFSSLEFKETMNNQAPKPNRKLNQIFAIEQKQRLYRCDWCTLGFKTTDEIIMHYDLHYKNSNLERLRNYEKKRSVSQEPRAQTTTFKPSALTKNNLTKGTRISRSKSPSYKSKYNRDSTAIKAKPFTFEALLDNKTENVDTLKTTAKFNEILRKLQELSLEIENIRNENEFLKEQNRQFLNALQKLNISLRSSCEVYRELASNKDLKL